MDGDTEIEESATVSEGDDPGVYVSSWTWIDDDDVREFLVEQYGKVVGSMLKMSVL